MPTTNLSVTFDGVNAATTLNGSEQWFDGFLGYYSVYEGNPANDFTADVSLSGSSWSVAAMRFGAAGTNTVTIADIDDGTDRRIDMLVLGYNSDVDLTTTRIRYVYGWDGDSHDVTLGSGVTSSVNLYAAQNRIDTGGANFVGNIETAGSSTVIVRDGSAGRIALGNGEDRVVTNAGYVDSINTAGGNDVVRIGAGAAGIVRTGAGDDLIRVNAFADPQVGMIIQGGSGVDTIDFSGIGSTGVMFRLSGGGAYQNFGAKPNDFDPAIGFVSESSIENVVGTRRNDRITGDGGANVIEGGRGVDRLAGDGGNDTLRGGGGRDFLTGGEGNDLLIGQAGRDVFIFAANSGDDRIRGFRKDKDMIEIGDHEGGFDTLAITQNGNHLVIEHDGGTIELIGRSGLTLDADDFSFF